jgi:hypothetical protein
MSKRIAFILSGCLYQRLVVNSGFPEPIAGIIRLYQGFRNHDLVKNIPSITKAMVPKPFLAISSEWL